LRELEGAQERPLLDLGAPITARSLGRDPGEISRCAVHPRARRAGGVGVADGTRHIGFGARLG